MDDQLQELINLQREQNQLLKKYLWRFRFSLLSLLLLTTATAIGLGLLAFREQSKRTPTATAVFAPAPTQGFLTIQSIPAVQAPPQIDTSSTSNLFE
jgi:hypothetical protein